MFVPHSTSDQNHKLNKLLNLICFILQIKRERHKMSFTPVRDYLGDLPDTSGPTHAKHYVPDPNKITAGTEILVYAWITTKGDEDFHRYYYQLETFDNFDRPYAKLYMNVTATKDIALNSSYLPIPVYPFGNSKCFT